MTIDPAYSAALGNANLLGFLHHNGISFRVYDLCSCQVGCKLHDELLSGVMAALFAHREKVHGILLVLVCWILL